MCVVCTPGWHRTVCMYTHSMLLSGWMSRVFFQSFVYSINIGVLNVNNADGESVLDYLLKVMVIISSVFFSSLIELCNLCYLFSPMGFLVVCFECGERERDTHKKIECGCI